MAKPKEADMHRHPHCHDHHHTRLLASTGVLALASAGMLASLAAYRSFLGLPPREHARAAPRKALAATGSGPRGERGPRAPLAAAH